MNSPGLLLGFDYGRARIGVAVGTQITGRARELCLLKARDGIPDWQQVAGLIAEWQPSALVVGLPLNMDGSPSEMSALAEKFARRLEGRFGLPTHTWDERLTSFEARGLRQQGAGAHRQQSVDALAAALLLESWLQQQAPTSSGGPP